MSRCLVVVYGLFLLILMCQNGQKLGAHARIIRRTKNDYDVQSTINSHVEISCELTNYYRSDVIWRKVQGVRHFAEA